jgi:5-methylcytosine-specific restriction endonuclease McrA
MLSKERKRERKRQHRINAKLKSQLFSDKVFAPCCYCKVVFWMSDLTIEHLTPLSFGGSNDPSNIALACAPCNHAKGKESWFLKKSLSKENYEQHTAQYRRKSRQTSVSEQ